MKTIDFDIQVPREMVAQVPIEPRDSSKLLVLDRFEGEIEHRSFRELPDYLEKGDSLVFNDSRVIPARLQGSLEDEPMEKVTVLLLRKLEKKVWECLIEVGEVKVGDIIAFASGDFWGEVVEVGKLIGKRKETITHIELSDESKIDSAGEMPVPPYVHSYKGDPEKYQTVYSKIRGSSAAPTAGLHFTNELLEKIRTMGVNICFVTLHVGIDTFMPVYETDPSHHKMYTEFCQLSKEVADILNETRKNGHRIIGVGTTSTRTLESCLWPNKEKFTSYSDWTNLYILPGYEFWAIDGMITNFHYPKSTNLMLVSALAGLDNIKKAYQEAVKERYRFYSFGDAMLII